MVFLPAYLQLLRICQSFISQWIHSGNLYDCKRLKDGGSDLHNDSVVDARVGGSPANDSDKSGLAIGVGSAVGR